MQRVQYPAGMIERIGGIRFLGECAAQQVQGLGKSPLPRTQHSEVVQRIETVWLTVEDGAIKSLGCRQVAGFMGGNPLLKQPMEGDVLRGAVAGHAVRLIGHFQVAAPHCS